MKIESIYREVMAEEARLRIKNRQTFSIDGLPYLVQEAPEEMRGVVWRLFENARAEFLSRSYNSIYNLCSDKVVYESVAAHSNLMVALVTEALDYHYGGIAFGGPSGARETVDGFSYREVISAVQLHDLPENEIGDIPDNGNRDEDEKNEREAEYFRNYIDTYQVGENDPRRRVLTLLEHMQRRDSPTGRLLFLADKVSASLVTLCLDLYVKRPMMHFESPDASDRDQLEMIKCDHSYDNGFFRASEMWTMDFLKIRQQVELDETMFFTGVLVMATLVVNDQWYAWRNEDYLESND